jgi:hypothetical protein
MDNNDTEVLSFEQVFKLGENIGLDRGDVGQILFCLMYNQHIRRVGRNYFSLTDEGIREVLKALSQVYIQEE